MNPKDQGKPHRITAREEQQLQRQLPGVDRFIAFFRAAGVPMGIGPDGHLWINRSQTRPLAWVQPSPKMLDWNKVIEVALLIVGDRFTTEVRENGRFGLDFHGVFRGREYVIMHGDVRVGAIHPTHAKIQRREVIYANFLMPGPHWQQVADVLHDAEPELVARWKHEQEAKAAAAAAKAKRKRRRQAEAKGERRRPAEAKRRGAAAPRRTDQLSGHPAEPRSAAARRRIDQLPDDLAPELIGACLDASRRIRLERRLDYGHTPVILECDVGELTLLPIAGPESRLLVPFRLSKGTETLAGQLILA
jgi:hypothetical protein